METTPGGWTVIDRDAGVFSAEYTFTKDGFARCMTARMGDGSILLVSPGARMSDACKDEIAELGPVGAVMSNNGLHHLGIPEWRARFPEASGYAPDLAASRIAKKNPEAGSLGGLAELQERAGDSFGVYEVANTRVGESWVWVKTELGYVWYVSDILINMAKPPAAFVPRMLFTMTKSAPGFRVFNLSLAFAVKNKKATLRALLEQMDAHPPAVIVPAHGEVLAGPTLAAEAKALIEAAL